MRGRTLSPSRLFQVPPSPRVLARWPLAALVPARRLGRWLAASTRFGAFRPSFPESQALEPSRQRRGGGGRPGAAAAVWGLPPSNVMKHDICSWPLCGPRRALPAAFMFHLFGILHQEAGPKSPARTLRVHRIQVDRTQPSLGNLHRPTQRPAPAQPLRQRREPRLGPRLQPRLRQPPRDVDRLPPPPRPPWNSAASPRPLLCPPGIAPTRAPRSPLSVSLSASPPPCQWESDWVEYRLSRKPRDRADGRQDCVRGL